MKCWPPCRWIWRISRNTVIPIVGHKWSLSVLVPSEGSHGHWSKCLTHGYTPKKIIKGENAQSRAWLTKKTLISWVEVCAQDLMSASSDQQVQSLEPLSRLIFKPTKFTSFIFRATTASFEAIGHTSDPGHLPIVHRAHPPQKQLVKTWEHCWQQFFQRSQQTKKTQKLRLDVRVKHITRFLKGCLTAEDALVGRGKNDNS